MASDANRKRDVVLFLRFWIFIYVIKYFTFFVLIGASIQLAVQNTDTLVLSLFR